MKNLRIQDNNRAKKETRWKTLLRKYEERNLLLKKQEQALRLQFEIEKNDSNDQPSIHLHDSNLLPTKDENVDSKQKNRLSSQILSHLGYAIRKRVPSLPLISANFQCSRKRLNITDNELKSSTYGDDCLNFQKPNKIRNKKTKCKCDASDGKKTLTKCELAMCKERYDKSEKYAEELKNLRLQLASTIQSMRGLESVNGQLRKEMCLLKDKSSNVTKCFIDQKLNEAHAIAKLKEKLLTNKKYFDDNVSLCMLARRVSETLMEMANYTEVDLKEVEKRIENIRKAEETLSKTELPKKNRVCICSSCCTCEEDLKKANLKAERIKQILSEKRDAFTTKSFGVVEDMLPDLECKPVKVIRGIEIVSDNIGQECGMLLDKLKGIELEEQLESGAIIEVLGEFDEQGEETGEYELDEFASGPTGELAELEENVRNIIHEDLLDFPSDYTADGFNTDFIPDRELIESPAGPLAINEKDFISEADQSVLGDRLDYVGAGPDYSEDGSGYSAAGPGYSEEAPDFGAGGPDYSEDVPGYTAGSPGYSDDTPGFTAAGPDYSEDVPGYTAGSSDYADDAPGFTGAGPDYSEDVPGYTAGSSDYADDAPGFTGAGPDYSEGVPGYTEAGPGYSEDTPGFRAASSDYTEGAPEGPGGTGYDDKSVPGYTGEGPDYSEGDPGYTGTGPDSGEGAGQGFAESGPGPHPSEGEGGYTGAGANYAEGGPGDTGVGLGYIEGGPDSATADRGFAEGAADFTGGGPHPSEDGAGYADPGANYAEGAPGFTSESPGYSESGPGYGGEGAVYGEEGSDFAGADRGPTEGASDFTGDASLQPSEDGSGYASQGNEGASGYIGADLDVEDAPDAIGATRSYSESSPSYTSGGPGYMEDIGESDAGYDQTKPSYSEEGREISEIDSSTFYDKKKQLSECELMYEEEGSTAEDEPEGSTGRNAFESGESISAKSSVYTEEEKNKEDHPPGCECVDCICSGVIEEREHAAIEKMTKGILETIDEEGLEDGKQGRIGGEKFLDESDQGIKKVVTADIQYSGQEKIDKTKTGISPDILDDSKCLDKSTCTDIDGILKLLSSIEPCSCAIQEKQEKRERRIDDSKTCTCEACQDQLQSFSSECLEPKTCTCQDLLSQIRDQLLPLQASHDDAGAKSILNKDVDYDGVVTDVPDEIGPNDYNITTAIADSGTIEIITEGPEGIIETSMTYTPSGNIDVETEITEYECPAKENCLTKARESELYADITEPFESGGQEDTDEIARDVADALNRANQEVMDALSRANQSVTDAMEKANRDVESALAMVMSRKSSSPMDSLNDIKTSEKAIQEEDEGDIVEGSEMERTEEGEFEHRKDSGEEEGKLRKEGEEEWEYGEEKPGREREDDIDKFDDYGGSFGREEDDKQWGDDEERHVKESEENGKEWEDGARELAKTEKTGEEGWKGGDDDYADRGRGGEGWEDRKGEPGDGRGKDDNEWEESGRKPDEGREKYDDEWESNAGKPDRGRDGEDEWESGVGKLDRGRDGEDELESDAGKFDRGRDGENEWESGAGKLDVDEGGETGSRWGGETIEDEWKGSEREPGKEGEDDKDAWAKERGEEYEEEWRKGERSEDALEQGRGENEWDNDDNKSSREREEIESQWDVDRILEEETSTKAWDAEGGALSTVDDTPVHQTGESGECTCEECLNKETDALRNTECTCTAECKCPICTDLKIIERTSRMSSPHPFGCTCIDCLCKENLLKGSLEDHKKHPADCDCIACICGPGDPDKSKKQCHPPDCECLQCICSPIGATKELICKISVKFSEHPEDCDCIDCICSKGIEETGVGDTCKYSDIKKEDEEVQLQMVKSAGDFAIETPCDHKPGCDCLECICETFESRIAKIPERRKSKSAERHIHDNNCDCLECLCKFHQAPSSCHSHESHPENCNCVHCLCEGEREITTEDIEGEFEKNDEIVTNIKVRSQCPYPGHSPGCMCTENYMKRSFGYETKPSECPCSNENLEPEILTLKMPVAERIEVTDVKRISSDSLLIKWTECAVNETTGYEIFVNGVSKSRVYTKFRTAAVLTSLTFDSDLDIKVYATYYGGHLEPPAKALFEVPNCDLNAKTKNYCMK